MEDVLYSVYLRLLFLDFGCFKRVCQLQPYHILLNMKSLVNWHGSLK